MLGACWFLEPWTDHDERSHEGESSHAIWGSPGLFRLPNIRHITKAIQGSSCTTSLLAWSSILLPLLNTEMTAALSVTIIKKSSGKLLQCWHLCHWTNGNNQYLWTSYIKEKAITIIQATSVKNPCLICCLTHSEVISDTRGNLSIYLSISLSIYLSSIHIYIHTYTHIYTYIHICIICGLTKWMHKYRYLTAPRPDYCSFYPLSINIHNNQIEIFFAFKFRNSEGLYVILKVAFCSHYVFLYSACTTTPSFTTHQMQNMWIWHSCM